MAEDDQQKADQEPARGRGRRVERQAVQDMREFGQRGAEVALSEGPHALLEVGLQMNHFAKQNSEAFSRSVSIASEGMLSAQEDVLQFSGMRLNKDLDHARALMSTRDIGDAINRQSDFVRESLEDYVEQVQSLLELGLRLTREGWTPLQARTEQAAQDMQRAAAE